MENYKDAFTAVPLSGYFINTIIFTAITTAMARARKSYSALPQFPSTERDVAFTCPIDMENALRTN